MPNTTNQPLAPLLASVHKFTSLRKRPLLILYYPPSDGRMLTWDVDNIYTVLRGAGLTREKKAPTMDLLIETHGGDPTAAFGIAQMIRMLTDDLTVCVAEHAFSAGTLLTFAGHSIRMADCSSLSPIDITLEVNGRPELGFELASLDAFMDFATDTRQRAERMLENHPGKASSVEAEVLVQMVREVGALNVGKFYRERKLTGEYAEHLLSRGALKGAQENVEDTIAHFLFGAPAHRFLIDSAMCRRRGLPVVDMPTEESDSARDIIAALASLSRQKIICRYLRKNLRAPFVQYFPVSVVSATGRTSGKVTTKNVTRRQRNSSQDTARAVQKPLARNGTRRGPVHA